MFVSNLLSKDIHKTRLIKEGHRVPIVLEHGTPGLHGGVARDVVAAAAAAAGAAVCVLGVDAVIGQEGRGRRRSHIQVLVRVVVVTGFVFCFPLPCAHREARRRAGRDTGGGNGGGGSDGPRRKGAGTGHRRRHGAEGEALVGDRIAAAAVAADGTAGRHARPIRIRHNARRVGQERGGVY